MLFNFIKFKLIDSHFSSLYNYIKLASENRAGSDYSLFKEGIQPMWEDDANKRGGKWAISLNKAQRTSDLDRLWLDVVSTKKYRFTVLLSV